MAKRNGTPLIFAINAAHNMVRSYRTGDEINVSQGKAVITSILHIHVKQGHIEIKGQCRLKGESHD